MNPEQRPYSPGWILDPESPIGFRVTRPFSSRSYYDFEEVLLGLELPKFGGFRQCEVECWNSLIRSSESGIKTLTAAHFLIEFRGDGSWSIEDTIQLAPQDFDSLIRFTLGELSEWKDRSEKKQVNPSIGLSSTGNSSNSETIDSAGESSANNLFG